MRLEILELGRLNSGDFLSFCSVGLVGGGLDVGDFFDLARKVY